MTRVPQRRPRPHLVIPVYSTKEKPSTPADWENEIDPEGIEVLETLGVGAQSIVSRVRDGLGNEYAQKKIPLSNFGGDYKSLVEEFKAQKLLCHENILPLKYILCTQNSLVLLMPIVDGASLDVFLIQSPKMPIDALGRLVWLTLQGLAYLRRKHYLHRDLKPSNLLLSRTGELKISDFGIARRLNLSNDKASTSLGSLRYMSPERIREDGYSFPSDIWSLGLIAYECALGHFPDGDHPCTTFWDIPTYDKRGIAENLKGAPEGLISFITSCLEEDPAKRATVEALVQNEWILKFNNSTAQDAFVEWIHQTIPS